MKRLFKGVIALCCALTCILGASSCATVKDGSKIQTVAITFEVDGKQEVINFELYLNFAPGTIDHFTYLSNQGYYTDTVVSNVKGHIEFGAYYLNNGSFKSKYDEDATKSYNSIISSYATADKYVGPEKDPRYNEDYTVVGEFTNNGFAGNTLGLDGALVLKRDINTEDGGLSYDSGKATMAITFGADDYFTSKNEFAIIGMVVTDDEKGSKDSSYDRLKDLMKEYAEDENGNIYYYYTYGGEVKNTLGNYFMYSDDGKYYAKDDAGHYTVEVDETEYEELLKEMTENPENLRTIPSEEVEIKIVSIVFGK